MDLLYPITPELVTLACATSQGFEQALKRECELSILRFRILSHLQQHGIGHESELSAALHTSISQLSQNLSKLLSRELVRWEWCERGKKAWTLTKEGTRELEDADAALLETYDRFFSNLDPTLHADAKTAVRLTGQAQGSMRVKDGHLFDELAYFESVLFAERVLTKATQELELNISQFRILYELLAHGPQKKARLARSLALARSTITWACDALSHLGLIDESGSPGRSGSIVLTKNGRELATQAVILADQRLYEMRVWSPEECANNQSVAEHFVERHCK